MSFNPLGGSRKKVDALYDRIIDNERRIDSLQEQVSRMPLEYVLKVDFMRELQQMHDHFRQINVKLDKLIEKL